MYTTYIIKNSVTNRYYIGSTSNFNRRIIEHNRGQTKSTRQKGIWEAVYKEEYNTSIEAKKREKQIKSYKGGNAFRKLFCGSSSVVECLLAKEKVEGSSPFCRSRVL